MSREAGVKFFRFNAGLAAILMAIALAFRFDARGTGCSGGWALAALVVSEAAMVLYWATVGRALPRIPSGDRRRRGRRAA